MAYLVTRIPHFGEPTTSVCTAEQASALRCMLFAPKAVGVATRLYGSSTWEFSLPKGETIRLAKIVP